ncbi:MAG: hypothetical protein ACT4P3_11400 [Betaproteobacteria bacterium]
MPTRLLVFLLAFAPRAALANHPLITEDTGVLGRGVWQLELHGEAIRDERDHYAAVLSYGVAERADLQLEAPRDGDATLSLKWRFLDAGPLSMAFKPDVADSGWGANLVGGYELGDFELYGHLGYARADGESARHYSAAVVWHAFAVLKLVLDLAHDTNPGRDTQVLGLTYALAREIDVGFGRKLGDERAWLLGAKFRW